MSPSALRAAAAFPRRAYRRSQARRTALEESRFRSRLRFDHGAGELVLSPHLDDAVLDCWGLLESERDVSVVNLFAGVPAPGTLAIWDQITGAADSAERVRTRLGEDARALALAGRTATNLTLLDAQYRPDAPAPTLDQLDRAVGEHVQSASRVHVPAGIGAHADHLLARRYGRMLARAGLAVTLYAELPYCVLHGWPGWVDGRGEQRYRNVDAFWSSFLAGVPEMPPLREAEVVRLARAQAQAKLAAMRCYETQLPCLSYGAHGLLSDPAIHAFEVRWELRPSAPAAFA